MPFDLSGNPFTSPFVKAGQAVGGALSAGKDAISGAVDMSRSSQYGEVDPGNRISDLAGSSTSMGWEGLKGYRDTTKELGQDRAFLRDLQSGKNSISAEQLRQGLQQQQAQQMSMAAGARPGQAPMAARTAMINAGRASSGMAGQQALAGIAERNAAAQQLAALNLGQRQQDIGFTLGNMGNALQGYGMNEQARTQRYMADMGVPSTGERTLGALGGGLGLGLSLSDRRAKKDIKRDENGAEKLVRALRPYSYKYKDKRNGEGEFLGVMAQDIEKAAPHAVIDTPKGKMVHGARLATALAAALPGLDKRLSKLEGK